MNDGGNEFVPSWFCAEGKNFADMPVPPMFQIRERGYHELASMFNDPTMHSRSFWIAVVAVSCAAVVFIVRTTMQPQYEPADFAVVWTSSRAWVAGDDPYDRTRALQHWVGAGGSADIMPADAVGATGEWMPILGIPPLLSLLAPLAILPAPAAVVVWYVIVAALLLAQTAALAAMIGSSLRHPRGLMLLAATLAFAPVHECFGYGQASGPCISFIILSIWAICRKREWAAGALLAIASALKPHLGGPFLLYYVLLGRWSVAGAFAAVFGLLTAVAVLPMNLRGTPWLAGWLDNLAFGASPGGLNSTSIENPARYHILNLQVILDPIFGGGAAVNAMAIVITAAFAMAFAWRRSRSRQTDELLFISAVCVITLLPVYHRFYDATLMLVLLAWAIAHLRDRPRAAWPLLAFTISFLVPARVISHVGQFIGVESAPAGLWWWDVLIEPWRTWLLLAGLIFILRAIPVTLTDKPKQELAAQPLAARAFRRFARLFPSRAAMLTCCWLAAIIVALLLDGTVSRLLRPYASHIARSEWAHEIKEIGHIVVVVVLAGFVAILHPLRWRGASLLLLSAVLAKCFYAVQRAALPRPKPVVAIAPYDFPPLHEVTSNLTRVPEYLWPSGHTLVAFATAATMAFLLPRGRFAFFAAAFIVGLERIAELAHYPSEIVACAALGLLAFWISRKLHDSIGGNRGVRDTPPELSMG
jgi:membrane-associated phospholipid phosphatase